MVITLLHRRLARHFLFDSHMQVIDDYLTCKSDSTSLPLFRQFTFWYIVSNSLSRFKFLWQLIRNGFLSMMASSADVTPICFEEYSRFQLNDSINSICFHPELCVFIIQSKNDFHIVDPYFGYIVSSFPCTLLKEKGNWN